MALSSSIREFGEDMTREVMLRLPVKSLLRFKCVSRFWYDQITSPDFIEKHLQISKSISRNCRTHMIILEQSTDCTKTKEEDFTPGNSACLISRKSQQEEEPAVDDDGTEIELPLREQGLIVYLVHYPNTRTVLNGRYHWLGVDEEDEGYNRYFQCHCLL